MSMNTALLEKFNDVEMFKTCEQCGLCSSACPITGNDGYNIRRILRHIELDMAQEIANTVQPWQCTTCGRCEMVCPNGVALLDFIRPLRALTPAECTPPEGPPPCVRACPGGIDIPGYVRLIAQGKPQEAYELIMDKAPFPGVLGRVCPHPCESQCRRKDVNQAVSICALKRYAADQAGEPSAEALKVEPDTGRKAAVVGSGPAGLTAAFFLRKKGHQVTVLEAKPKAGGMMRYGIPAYRLPEDVLDQEIGRVLGVGVELKTSQRLGEDFDLGKLKSDGYDAIFLALGLPQSRKIDLEGAESQGVLWGVDFLAESRQGQAPAVSGKVVVIGGGAVAVDVALTAKRLGADEVVMACLESREEMPANPWEIDMALEEGVRLMPSWGPRRILAQGGKAGGVELIACTSVFDAKGRFAPQFDEKATDNQTADIVILAVGQMADASWASGELTMNNGLIAVDPESQATSLDGVFAGGDGASGPGALIEAIAAGRRAAAAMDKYLGGDGVIGKAPAEGAADPDYDGKRELGFADRERVAIPCLPVEERIQGFMEVDLCLGDDEARFEANRCLQCDLERALVNALKAANG